MTLSSIEDVRLYIEAMRAEKEMETVYSLEDVLPLLERLEQEGKDARKALLAYMRMYAGFLHVHGMGKNVYQEIPGLQDIVTRAGYEEQLEKT